MITRRKKFGGEATEEVRPSFRWVGPNENGNFDTLHCIGQLTEDIRNNLEELNKKQEEAVTHLRSWFDYAHHRSALKLFLCALCVLCGESALAQNTRVTSTFKTQDQLTPLAAKLDVLACVSATTGVFAPTAGACATGTAVYGRGFFRSVDTGRNNQPREITCGGFTYPPQSVPVWIKSDGVLIAGDEVAGVLLIPTAGCEPSGLAYELAGDEEGRSGLYFNRSTVNRRPPHNAPKQYKAISAQASVDWASLSPAAASASVSAVQMSSQGNVSDFEKWVRFAAASVPSAASGQDNVFIDVADAKLKARDAAGALRELGGAGGAGDITDVGNCATAACFQAQAINQVFASPSSGGAGVAAFRALVEADIPTLAQSKITSLVSDLAAKQPLDADLTAIAALAGTGFARRTGADTWAVAGIADADVPNDITLDKLRDTIYFADAYADLQAAIDAVTALPGGGIIQLTAGVTYPCPAAGLRIKDKVIVRGTGQTYNAASPAAAIIDCSAVTSGVVGVDLSGAFTHFYGFQDVVIKTRSSTNTGARIADPGVKIYFERVTFLAGSNQSTDTATYALFLDSIVDRGHSIRDITISRGNGGASYSRGIWLKCGSSNSDGATIGPVHVLTTAANAVVVDAGGGCHMVDWWIDEVGTAGTASLNFIGGASDHTFVGGAIHSATGSQKAVDICSTCNRNIMLGTQIRPFAGNTPTTLVSVAGDFNQFLDMKMNEGTATNAFVFAAGADNNFVRGQVSNGAISDSGSGNKTSLFDGANWVGDISFLGQTISLSAEVTGILGTANGGTGDDTSGATGIARVTSGNWTYDAAIAHLASSSSADLRGVLSDESGLGVPIFATITSPAAFDVICRNSGNTDWVNCVPGQVVVDATTSRTLVADDNGKHYVFTNAAAVTVTVTDSLAANWGVQVSRLGAGTLTLNRQTAGTIDGSTSLTLENEESVLLDTPGANAYYTARGRLRTHTHQSTVQGGTLDAAAIAAGTLNDARLSASVSLLGQTIGAAELETDSVSADELNAAGVEAELEAVLDLPDLQGVLSLAKGGTNQTAWTASRCVQVNAGGTALESAAAACGSGGSGDNISVNGTAATDADFDDATPAAPADSLNVRWQKDALTPNNLSANILMTAITKLGTITAGVWNGTAIDEANLDGNVVLDNASNTYSTGTQDFTSVTALIVKIAAAYAPTADGSFGYDSTADTFKGGGAGAITGSFPRVLAQGTTAQTFTNSVTSAQDFTTSQFAIPANYLITNRCIRASYLVEYVTGATTVTYNPVLRLGGADVVTYNAPFDIANSVTRSAWLSFDICGTAAAGATASVLTGSAAGANFPNGTGNLNATDQPVTFDTTASLTVSMRITFSATTATETYSVLAWRYEEWIAP